MRITAKSCLGQLLVLLLVFSFSSCSGRAEETPIIPPVTSVLSRDYIGYGVITASFTHIMAEPDENSTSENYLRRGSIVRIARRQDIRTGSVFVTWVFIDEPYQGWLKEETMDIYNSESQAKTASEVLSR